ncbi:hypothetical protein [Spirulina sp. 06S082]|uniref:hypothetical protein n=1 Tax=Spirulina sp. 06S082 TaxID=3110248 RepID=UPI002B20DE58|nr:hypothetical protein [Spirulina sp. 06S082]MEA5470425.1 hypothetical protein [Spirulina sp. 06S082]
MNDPLKLVQLFSRFPRFKDVGNRDRLIWRSNSALHRNMWRFLDRQNNPSEDTCARYFLQLLQNAIAPEHPDDLAYAQKHLMAYLCLSSYSVAKSIHQKHRKIDFFQHRYEERDYLQIAMQYANNPQKLLSGFDFKRRHKDGDLYFVKTFAKAVLERRVKDELYKYNKESILGKYKDWGLLRYDTTLKELKIALRSQIEEVHIEEHLFVWNCFKEICKPSQNRSDPASPPPNAQELKTLVCLYQNHELFVSQSGGFVNEKKIEKMLQSCIEAMRDHRLLKIYYPDSLLNFEGDRWDNFFITLNNWEDNDPVNSIVREEERNEIYTLVGISFEKLASENKTLLLLWKGFNLNQTQIGLAIDLPQYAVSRRLKKARQLMLKEFVKKIQQHFNLHLDSDAIESAKEQMEEVLKKYATNLFKSLLENLSLSFQRKLIGDRETLLVKTMFLQAISQELNVKQKNLSKVTVDIDTFLQENIH